MRSDCRGLELSTTSERAASLYDEAVGAYFQYRLTTGKLLKAALGADPEFLMGHLLKGYLFMLFGSQAFYARVRESLAFVEARLEAANPRERAHAEALRHWLAGDLSAACAAWDRILFEHPLDLLALRLHHFNTFWMGRSRVLRSTVSGVLDAWDPATTGYGNVLGMLAFAQEECGDYEAGERHGRHAVEIDPDDLWAIHAVAHVLEMQGRLADGVRWLDYPPDRWADRNPFRGHLWWHAALFPLEQGDHARALAIYDRSVQPEQTEFYLDIQNMASLLLRLELQGADVGERWRELADHAQTRTEDHVLAFTDVHCMMALAACGRRQAVARLIESLHEHAARPNDWAAASMEAVTIPLCEAIAAFGEGDHEGCVDRLLPIRHELAPIGGSHAQRDVFHQLLLEAAIRCGRMPLARHLLSERIALRERSHGNWVKYAQVLETLGEAEAAEGARTRAAEIRAAV